MTYLDEQAKQMSLVENHEPPKTLLGLYDEEASKTVSGPPDLSEDREAKN